MQGPANPKRIQGVGELCTGYERWHGKERLGEAKGPRVEMTTRGEKDGKNPRQSIDNSNRLVLNKHHHGRCSGEANEWHIGSKTWRRKDILK